VIDFDNLREFKYYKHALANVSWLTGIHELTPDIEMNERQNYGMAGIKGKMFAAQFVITPEDLKESVVMPAIQIPPEIQESLAAFKKDHPDPSKVGFIAMRFEKSTAHDAIVAEIKQCAQKHNLTALRADDK
jgi:hypothetical protein